MSIRVASVAWKIRFARSDGEFFAHFYDLMNDAHKLGAELVVLPELTCLELLPLAPDLEEKDIPAFLVQFGESIEEWLVRIARSSGMTLVGGSHFRHMEGGIVNACATASPDGKISVTAKNKLTAYESSFWRLRPGQELARLPDERFGVLVGDDSEFPAAGKALVEAGARAFFVPACSQTPEAFDRVRNACQVQADQNQAFVVHSSLVGSLGYGPIPESFGSSAILGPGCTQPLSETVPDREGIAIADLDFAQLAQYDRQPSADWDQSVWKVS